MSQSQHLTELSERASEVAHEEIAERYVAREEWG
jgi:hypothetical protein